MDYAAYYRKADKADWQAYYDAVAEKMPTDPQATARTRDAEDTIPCEARNVMFNIAAEIKTPSTSSARRCPRCLFDKDIKFPTGKTCTVCGNVTGTVSYGSRYAAVFDVTGDRSQHIGNTHGDHIIKCAPDFNGVVDEDDRPIQASCC